MQAQKIHFPEEYAALLNNEQIPQNSQLKKLNPKLKDGIIIMISRLNYLQAMPEQIRNPIILPNDARISTLITLQQHRLSGHSGPELTLRNTRLNYWILGGRQQIRKTLKGCDSKICKYPNLDEVSQRIANLPIARITPGNFQAISLDFAGHFFMKKCGICKNQNNCKECRKGILRKKNCTVQKVWICVFVCHASRAVHLELLQDKTTESFLLAIKRMANRRGMPNIIHSDNAREMILAKEHIKDLYQKLNTANTHKQLANKYNIKWYHSTERSPQHNGVVERIVQVVKKPFYKILDGKILTETELTTVLTDCESASNMRPLTSTSQSADDNNLLPITPSHLVLGKALTPLPTDINSYEEKNTQLNAKERWKERKNISHHYWNLWKEEYLLQLRTLTKNYFEKKI